MTAVELFLIGVVLGVVALVFFALIGGLASWVVASRTVDWAVRDVQPRNSFDAHVSTAPALVDLVVDEEPDVHEALDGEESNETAADFLLWADEIAQDARIAKHLRRMERWSQ